jgi:hypothetical protein
MSTMQVQHPELELLEATDQEALYVEIWPFAEEKDFNTFKQERKELNHSQWSIILPWIVGGSGKMNIWRFHRK